MKSIKLWLETLYRNEMFHPKWIGLFVNPFYFARKGLAARMAELGGQITGKTLDIGCGSKPYQHLCHSSEYIGLELDSEASRSASIADYYYDGRRIPFRDAEFDSVLSNQVLEHVFHPGEFLDEIRRVVKPDGKILLTVPFAWDEHEVPRDYARYTSYGLQFLLREHGFEVLEFTKTMSDIRAVFQLLNLYLNSKLKIGKPYLNLILRVVLISPLNIMGELLAKIAPSYDKLYLDNVVLARRLNITR